MPVVRCITTRGDKCRLFHHTGTVALVPYVLGSSTYERITVYQQTVFPEFRVSFCPTNAGRSDSLKIQVPCFRCVSWKFSTSLACRNDDGQRFSRLKRPFTLRVSWVLYESILVSYYNDFQSFRKHELFLLYVTTSQHPLIVPGDWQPTTMRWPLRSSRGHDRDHIEFLNSKFRLRIPMSSSPNITLKKLSLHHDDSTACSSFSSDSSVSSTRTARKQVHFCDDAIEFQPERKVLTRADSESLWFSRAELSEIKSTFRRIYNRENQDSNFKEAVTISQRLFSREELYVFADTDNDEITDADNVTCQALYYKDAARTLGLDDARGLERFLYGTTTTSKSSNGTKWQHMQKYVLNVLDAQKLVWDWPPERRAAFIASKCHSLPSVVWALASADADAEALRAHVETNKREFLEV